MRVWSIRQVSDGNPLATKWSGFTALLVGFLLLAQAAPAAASGNAIFSLSPNVTSIGLGQTFDVAVYLKQNGEAIDTARIVLSYPSSVVEAIRWTPTKLFENESPYAYLDNIAGSVSQGRFNLLAVSTQDGKIGTFTFRAKASGIATIELTNVSHLIQKGEEKIDPTSFTSIRMTVGSGTVSVPAPAPLPAPTNVDATFKLLTGRLPNLSNTTDVLILEYLNGKVVEVQDVTKEKAALTTFTKLFGRLPSSGMDWNIIHALAYAVGVAPAPVPAPSIAINTSAIFQKLTGRLPNGLTESDVLALAYIDGKDVEFANQDAERVALPTFAFTYGRMPSTSLDWDIVHALAYAILPAATPLPLFETAGVIIPAARNLPLETEAQTTFASLANVLEGSLRAPSSDADILAFFGMVYGYKPAAIDSNKEAAALQTFINVFGHSPVRDFAKNIVKVLAYISPFAAL